MFVNGIMLLNGTIFSLESEAKNFQCKGILRSNDSRLTIPVQA